uniref:Uncharacterized protein n=1 Tax=Caenorhabditis japonica TaxID=281687 RepID=A0A8R1HPF7_CAEJA
MKGLAKLMSFSNNRIYNDQEIDDVQRNLDEFLEDMKLAFPKETVSPKLHLLAHHLIPYMRKHRTWGKTSEQGIEHYHAKYNTLKRKLQPIRNLMDRSSLIVRELSIKNHLHDTGSSLE